MTSTSAIDFGTFATIDERTMGDYKTEKEAFHADNPGSSVHLINAISLVSLVSCPVAPL